MPFKGGQKSFKKPWASGPLTIKEKIAKIMAVAHCAIKLENRHFQKGFEPPTPTSKPSLWMCDKCIDSWSLRGPGPGEGRGRAGGGPGVPDWRMVKLKFYVVFDRGETQLPDAFYHIIFEISKIQVITVHARTLIAISQK